MTVELYARATASSPTAGIQNLRFADLFFPDRPPYLDATYQSGEVGSLFEEDIGNIANSTSKGAALKSQLPKSQQDISKICRAIIQIKRKQQPASFPGIQAVEVTVLSMWETDWKDVERVRGIVEPQYQEEGSNIRIESPISMPGELPTTLGPRGHVQFIESRGSGWKRSKA